MTRVSDSRSLHRLNHLPITHNNESLSKPFVSDALSWPSIPRCDFLPSFLLIETFANSPVMFMNLLAE